MKGFNKFRRELFQDPTPMQHSSLSLLWFTNLPFALAMVAAFSASILGQDPAHDGAPTTEELVERLRAQGVGIEARVLLKYDPSLARERLAVFHELVVLAKTLEGATWATRERHVLVNHREDREHFDPSFQRTPSRLYPMAEAASKVIGSEPIPLLLVPSPQRLRAVWAGVSPSEDELALSPRPWVSTLHFHAPETLEGPFDFPCPMPAPDVQGPVTNPFMKSYVDPRRLGFVAGQSAALERAQRALEGQGIEILRRVDVVELMPELYGVSDGLRSLVGVVIADANGAARGERSPVDAKLGSWFRNRVVNAVGEKKDATVVVRPLPVGAEEMETHERPRDQWTNYRIQERVLVTDAQLDDAPAIAWRKLPSWRPFMEDIEIVGVASSRSLPSGVLGVVLRADADLATWMRVTGAYFGVDLLDSAAGRLWLAKHERR